MFCTTAEVSEPDDYDVMWSDSTGIGIVIA